MILQCPVCRSRYNVPDEKVGGKGVRVTCPRCSQKIEIGLDGSASPVGTPMGAPGRGGDPGRRYVGFAEADEVPTALFAFQTPPDDFFTAGHREAAAPPEELEATETIRDPALLARVLESFGPEGPVLPSATPAPVPRAAPPPAQAAPAPEAARVPRAASRPDETFQAPERGPSAVTLFAAGLVVVGLFGAVAIVGVSLALWWTGALG